LGCLRPPWGGTDAIVPSISFSSACCTPSPETSRVIEGLSDYGQFCQFHQYRQCLFAPCRHHNCNSAAVSELCFRHLRPHIPPRSAWWHLRSQRAHLTDAPAFVRIGFCQSRWDRSTEYCFWQAQSRFSGTDVSIFCNDCKRSLKVSSLRAPVQLHIDQGRL